MARTMPGEAKQKIIEAAIPLFAEKGYNATSIRDIARAAGVNQNTIFRVFRDKYSLYLEMFALVHSRLKLVERVQAAMDSAENDAAAILAGCRALAEVLRENPGAVRLLLFVGLENAGLTNRILSEAILPFYLMMAERVHRGVERGTFREVHPMTAARALVDMHFYHYVLSHLFGGKDVPRLDVGDPFEDYCRIWLDGVSSGRDRV